MPFGSLRNTRDGNLLANLLDLRQMRFESSPRKGVITAGSFVSASLQGRQQRQCAEGEKEA